jgi:pSer/pThr/pTyr-binding forkhead associated (FHA) protein
MCIMRGISSTGTFVNGAMISGKTKLHPGDNVSFGTEMPMFVVHRNIFAHA